MAKVLSSISLDAPASPVTASTNDTFAFSGTPSFSGGGGVQRYDFKWQVDAGGGYVTIGASGTGLITAGTNPVINTNSQSQNSITVTCDAVGSYTIRMAGAPTSGGSYTVLSATQTVEVSDASVTVTPDTAALTTQTFAPTVTATDNKTVTPGVVALTTSTFAPTVTATQNRLVTPGTATLTLSTFAPTVTGGSGTTVTPDTATLALETFAPSVSVSDNQVVTPDTATLSLSAFAPTVTATQHQLVTPSAAVLAITTFAPDVYYSGGGVGVVNASGDAGSGKGRAKGRASAAWGPQEITEYADAIGRLRRKSRKKIDEENFRAD